MMMKLIQIELIKTNKSLALLMMFLSPLMVILVNLLLFINRGGEMVEAKGWGIFWLTNYGMWGYFMMPLYIALITTLLNGIEHQSNGWRYMMSLPIKQKDIFVAKFILAWVYLIGASLVLFISIFLTILILSALGYSGADMISYKVVKNLAYATISCLGILSIQHIVSWRWKNVIIPLGLGVLATMSIMQFSSSEYWVFNPWTYTLMATNAANADMQTQALLYSILYALVLSLIGMKWLGKREITC